MKYEITDEMVERACKAHWGKWPPRAPRLETATPEYSMRKALEAALNPPPEPEIPVSEGMIRTGHAIMNTYRDDAWGYGPTDQAIVEMYRTMEKQRREESK